MVGWQLVVVNSDIMYASIMQTEGKTIRIGNRVQCHAPNHAKVPMIRSRFWTATGRSQIQMLYELSPNSNCQYSWYERMQRKVLRFLDSERFLGLTMNLKIQNIAVEEECLYIDKRCGGQLCTSQWKYTVQGKLVLCTEKANP